MKRRSFVVGTTTFVCLASTSVGAAQETSPDALTVAGAVQSFYGQVTRVQSRFQQHYWSHAHQTTTQNAHGRLAVHRPGRLRMDYDTPRGQVVVSQAGRFTLFTPEEDGPGQYAQGSTNAVGAAFGILDGTADLARDFRFALSSPTSSDPPDTDRLVLTPRRASPYVSIVLHVSREERSRGVIRRMSIQMPDGDWNRFDFSAEQYGASVSLPSFDFVIPDGARRQTL